MVTQTSTTPECKYSFKKALFLLIGFICFLNILVSNQSYAQGTQAGTNISNVVTVNYTINGTAQEPIESSPTGNTTSGLGNGQATIFKVDRKIDLVLTGDNNANVTPGDSQSEVTFTLLNEGNDIQIFELTADPAISSDNFDTSSCTTTVTAVSGTPLAGVVIPTASGDIKLAPDQQASISIKCDIPLNNGLLPLISGDTSLLSLKAVASKNNDGSDIVENNAADSKQLVDTVFADDAGTDDSARDASHSARRIYTASTSTVTPTLSINKSIVEVLDSDGGNNALSGSEVTYKIKITTNGMGTINNIVITDITPAGMTYKAGTIALDSTGLTDDGSDSDGGDFGITSTNTATINIGNITAGNHHEIQLTYTVN